MFEKLVNLQLSFPVRVIALVITIVFFIGATLFSLWIGKGTITINVAQPEGYVLINEEQHPTPYTATLRAGRKIILVGAKGYVDEDKQIVVPTFLQKRDYSFNLTEPLLYEYESDIAEQVVQKKYPWAKDLPIATSDFEIELPDAADTFDITLAPTAFTAPGVDAAALEQTLIADKKKALDWLKSKGAKTEELKINWIPYDPDNPPQ